MRMDCVQCGEPIRGSAMVCLACGKIQPAPVHGSGLARPFSRDDWQPLPPAPLDRSPEREFHIISFAFEFVFSFLN
jgi:hypothetical protein